MLQQIMQFLYRIVFGQHIPALVFNRKPLETGDDFLSCSVDPKHYEETSLHLLLVFGSWERNYLCVEWSSVRGWTRRRRYGEQTMRLLADATMAVKLRLKSRITNLCAS